MYEKIFIKWLEEKNIGYTKEYKFHFKRRWRFDYALTQYKIAIEIEGGVWIRGRHSRGKGMINDMEKYNCATLLGWKVLRYTPQNLLQSIKDIEFLLA